jgi:hypothetical protein
VQGDGVPRDRHTSFLDAVRLQEGRRGVGAVNLEALFAVSRLAQADEPSG